MSQEKKHFAKKVELGVGTHAFGNSSGFVHKLGDMLLELTSVGVLATSVKHGKKAMIPWANIKAVELPMDSEWHPDYKGVDGESGKLPAAPSTFNPPPSKIKR